MVLRSVDRPNICLVAMPITASVHSFQDLFFVIPEGLSSAKTIPKTLIFADSLKETCDITSALLQRIPRHMYQEEDHIVAEFSSGISHECRKYNLELFTKGVCRILVCTEACGMGVDIPDVSRVIQWRLSPQVNLSTLV